MRTSLARMCRCWRATLLLGSLLTGMYGFTGSWLLPSARAQSEANDPAEPGMLVLTTDRVVSGRILRTGRDYLVKMSNGEMFVPASLVRLRCRNLQDAYRQLRLAFPENHGAEYHMRLARWCITQNLFSEARQELKDALSMEPDRAEARDMLQRLDSMLDPPDGRKPQNEKNIPAIIEATRQGIRQDEVESLGGLPHSAATHFVRRIQPLLMNQCALSGCHGPQEENNFRLQRVIPGSHSNRHTVERNLANILKFIDTESPRQSPLLLKPKGSHGKRGRSIFVGQRGTEQYRELKDWVLTVANARDEAASVAARKPAGRRTAGKIQPVSHKTDAIAESSVDLATSSSKPSSALSPRRKGKPPADDSPAPRGERPDRDQEPAAVDPFDPDEFNRSVRN